MREDASRTFVRMPVDKHAWRPSLLPGQIVLLSTVDGIGEPNVAPKSWVSMVAFGGPVLGFGCNLDHRTYHNLRATGEFVVNVPDETLAPRIWDLIELHGSERIDESGLELLPASTVRAPLVGECRGHLECRYLCDEVFEGGEVFVFGTVVAADIDEACTVGDAGTRYRRLGPLFFLETGLYAGLGTPRRVTSSGTHPREPPA